MSRPQAALLRQATIRDAINQSRQYRARRGVHGKAKSVALAASSGESAVRWLAMTLLASLLLMVHWGEARATEIQRVISDAGIEAWLVEDNTVPIIAMDFSFAGGSTQDPSGKAGTAAMLSSLLDEGADDMDSQAFQTALEENAIKLSFDAGRDRFYGSLRTLTPNRQLAFDLLAKALQKPLFDAEPIERMRAQWIVSAKQELTDPDSIAARALREAAFGDHPYGIDPEGSQESLAAITRDDILAMHKNIFTRQGLKIGVVGAIDAESLKAMLDAVFAPLPASGTLLPVEDLDLTKTGEFHVDFATPQTKINFAMPGIDRHDEDFYAAYIVNHILGGGSFSSRLYNEIREKRGLAYGVYSYLADYDHVQILAGGMATRTDNTDQALLLVKQEIHRLGNEGPTEEELESAKKYLIGSYPLRFDSSSKISRQLVGIQEEDLGIDYFDKRNTYMEKVTLEDAKRAAKRLLDPSKLLIVTVGQQIKHASAEPQASGKAAPALAKAVAPANDNDAKRKVIAN
nr:pitrilysin family protein [uncultured Cohaesibacter sp.]